MHARRLTSFLVPYHSSPGNTTQITNNMRNIYKLMKISICALIMLAMIYPAMALNPTPIPDYDFDKNFDNLTSSNLTLSNLTTVGAAPYEDLIGAIFWGLLFTVIFAMLWITMEDITIPALLGMIIGASIWYLLPGEWVKIGMSLTVISMAGIVYSYLKKV